MKRFIVTTSIGLVAVAFAIAGCGGSAAGGTSAPATASGNAQAAPPAASAESGASAGGQASAGASQAAAGNGGTVEDGIGHAVNICDLLPVATVASISGEPLTVAKEDDTPNYKTYSCSYMSANGTSGLDVNVLALDAAAGFDSTLQANSTGARQISGLGDKAFTAITGVEALFGNVSITVSNLQSDDAAITLIKTLQPKL